MTESVCVRTSPCNKNKEATLPNPSLNTLHFLLQRRQFLTTDSFQDAQDPASCSLLPRHFEHIFSDQSLGLLIARFLRPSEVRALIVILQLKRQPVVGYFEFLCRSALVQDELNDIVSEYHGGLLTRACANNHESHWAYPTNANNKDGTESSADVTYVGATFDPSFGKDAAARCLPFELIYKVEVFSRYCDECHCYVKTPERVKPHIVRIPNTRSSQQQQQQQQPCLKEKSENQEALSSDASCKASGSKSLHDFVTVDLSLASVILCSKCSKKFVPRESVEILWARIRVEIPLLKHCRCLPEISNSIQLSYDHLGTLVCRAQWEKLQSLFTQGHQRFMEQFRSHFTKRMTRRFGQSFYQHFIHRILPCDRFLELDAKQRKYNPLPWISRLSTTGKRTSRFQHGPYIERYPLGSLERSTAHRLSQDFQIWSSSTSIETLIAAEARIADVLLLAWNVVHHSDYSKAASIVEDYVLTREIDRDMFDRLYLPSLWRVLHRGSTREPRRFTSCIYDRQRIDKFFAPCCIKPPVLPIRGYLGFETAPPADQQPLVHLSKPVTSAEKPAKKRKARDVSTNNSKTVSHCKTVMLQQRLDSINTTPAELPSASSNKKKLLSGAATLQAALEAAERQTQGPKNAC